MASTHQPQGETPWFLQSSAPVLLPTLDALTYPRDEFEAYIHKDLASRHDGDHVTMDDDPTQHQQPTEATSESFTLLTSSTTTAADLATDMDNMKVDATRAEEADKSKRMGHPFMDALFDNAEQDEEQHTPNLENKMFTDNGDITNASTTSPLVDLFAELENVITGPRLNDLLHAAWAHDALATLKIIFNARSIHLGKSSRKTFYLCAGWLATHHPHTLIANLPWLSRPVIQKKEKKDDDDADLVIVEAEKDENDPARHNVRHGVSHGYWKDLLNILALAANDKLHVLANPSDVLNIRQTKEKKTRKNRPNKSSRVQKTSGRRAPTLAATKPELSTRQMTESQRRAKDKVASKLAKEDRITTRQARQARVASKLQTDPVYRALHLAIARLFAQQLQIDTERLKSNDRTLQKDISLCAKWAPSHDRFHDRHTLIATSIAEILFPMSALDLIDTTTTTTREVYLRHAREAYRKTTSALRAHLDIVERNITAQTYDAIRYERLPSQAMRQYTPQFVTHDYDRFEAYLDKVASGQTIISGATLLPSVMVHSVSHNNDTPSLPASALAGLTPAKLLEHRKAHLAAQVLDGQWKTLVQRIRDAGTLRSSIAVCDVSGSMGYPVFPDGTIPMDSSIGLSLLVASVTEPPYGGAFITFHDKPTVQRVDLAAPFSAQVRKIRQAPFGFRTDFEAVFTQCILPLARKHKVRREDMVKRVFVFSDMQFDQARGMNEKKTWSSSLERIRKEYARFGYEVPELIFWNLAGGRGGVSPKPVTTADQGTAMVSGYSQGLLKVFLDSGGFEEAEEEEEVTETVEGEDSMEVTTTTVVKKNPMDPLNTVKKAIGHPAYAMLRVVD
ncbi:uncharacterized protein F5Z01DRAFT_641746 [Emericellopsis atlantica]|uniref:Uncharacterized protein n=1 Tax=Emericellopsis atlantica TaxID=2614577 RepID=A0A9P8CT90_9HYPO|nr:uncharacterized protein F5Z01DRAFT_641746 [Emericellopsis atlantica]KAG9258899.1 hypothetical protein F5Z01DRAFT_641746 [Emericellopsis atlantica]